MALISRRAFVLSVTLARVSVLARGVGQRGPWAQGTAPALVTSDSLRPSIPYGVASGDMTSDAAIIWSRTNKPSRMLVEYDTTDSFIHSHDLLAAYTKRAFGEYTPIRFDAHDPERIYRAFGYGPSLDIFMLDERSYRGPNSENRQGTRGAETAFLGMAQVQWLKRALLNSRATWKVIASDMPLGLQVPDILGFEAWANGDGPALGRELELAELLRFIKDNTIKNVVWLTADVHYAAAHLYDPVQAQFTDFNPFWEFVAGPLHAGTFGPNKLDNTFGPQVKFLSIPNDLKPNRPPSDGLQFFGMVKVSGTDEVMRVSLHNLRGEKIYSLDLSPEV